MLPKDSPHHIQGTSGLAAGPVTTMDKVSLKGASAAISLYTRPAVVPLVSSAKKTSAPNL